MCELPDELPNDLRANLEQSTMASSRPIRVRFQYLTSLGIRKSQEILEMLRFYGEYPVGHPKAKF